MDTNYDVDLKQQTPSDLDEELELERARARQLLFKQMGEVGQPSWLQILRKVFPCLKCGLARKHSQIMSNTHLVIEKDAEPGVLYMNSNHKAGQIEADSGLKSDENGSPVRILHGLSSSSSMEHEPQAEMNAHQVNELAESSSSSVAGMHLEKDSM